MKTFLATTGYKEIDIEFPFYAYEQSEEEEIFLKIDGDRFYQITNHLYGKVEIFICKYSGSIASIWYENQSNKEKWDIGVTIANNFVDRVTS
jgi:hypothetical protein